MVEERYTKEQFLRSENGEDLTREQMIEEMIWHDNVGMLDGVNLEQLSNDEIRDLRAEIIVYFINRQSAWSSVYERKSDESE